MRVELRSDLRTINTDAALDTWVQMHSPIEFRVRTPDQFAQLGVSDHTHAPSRHQLGQRRAMHAVLIQNP